MDDSGGLRGWSFRLAERIARAQGGLLYANLAVRGATTGQIADRQLGRAVRMKPDLATVFTGTNDVLRPRFDLRRFALELRTIHEGLHGAGATVITFTLPDITRLLPLARPIAPRIHAMNDVVREVCATTGTRLLDFAAVPVATDPRLWNEDRVHANPAGHARIADALAEALGLPGTNSDWREPLPPVPAPGAVTFVWRELRWSARHLVPWTLGALSGRDGLAFAGRRPGLEPFA